jgi:hypothetical protein
MFYSHKSHGAMQMSSFGRSWFDMARFERELRLLREASLQRGFYRDFEKPKIDWEVVVDCGGEGEIGKVKEGV